MAQKLRQWISKDEMDRVKQVLHENLGSGDSCLIPFETVLPALDKPEITRLLWCRQAKDQLRRWGIKMGIRTQQRAYLVKCDRHLWNQAIAGLVPLAEPAAPTTSSCQRPPDESFDVRHLIPEPDPHYVLPDWVGDLKIAIDHDEKVMLVGETGCGKSSLIREICARERRPFFRVNMNGETSVADIIGGWKVRGREMVFQYGPVPQAMKTGSLLCLDEIDSSLPQALFCLQGLLEDQGKLFIPELNEWITPHTGFRVAATANTLGKGESSSLYAGTNVLNESFLDRFHSVFAVEYFPAEQETFLLLNKVKGLGRETAERMVKVANDLRQAMRDGVIYSTFSTRKLIAWARKTLQLQNPSLASIYTVQNRLSSEDRQVVSEVLQRYGF